MIHISTLSGFQPIKAKLTPRSRLYLPYLNGKGPKWVYVIDGYAVMMNCIMYHLHCSATEAFSWCLSSIDLSNCTTDAKGGIEADINVIKEERIKYKCTTALSG